MSSNPGGLLRAALRGLAALPPPDSDSELLERYVVSRDEAAFAALVRRHGPMVLGVCRRRLGGGPDAEDAFQVTFMVLARDAKRIGRRESLPGWLYRVAYLVALKASGRRARHPAEPLREQDAADRHDPYAEAAAGELRAALDAELSALPDKLRAVVVLCGLEQRTNAEAAKLLGCPTGTVDSRLSAARQKLRDRLARRGFALATAAALDGLLRPPAVAYSVSMLLLDQTVRGATGYAVAGGCATEPLSTLADGVTPIMGSAKLKLLVAAGMSLAVFGTASVGLYHADGQEKASANTDAKRPAEAKKPQSPPSIAKKPDDPEKPAVPSSDGAGRNAPVLADEASVRVALTEGIPTWIGGAQKYTLGNLFDMLYKYKGIIVRPDMATFRRLGLLPDDVGPEQLYELHYSLPNTRGMSVGDVLNEALAQVHFRYGAESPDVPLTYQIRGNQVLIVPAFQPSTIPGTGPQARNQLTTVNPRIVLEQIIGPPVSIAVKDIPFSDALQQLRERTGANIVIDGRCLELAKSSVSGSFSDVRLLTVLNVLADMCEMKPVMMNNVYYITRPENAAKLQEQVNRDLFGESPKPAAKK
jgi:RNA polymerase sigma factor (sigma-70 family)